MKRKTAYLELGGEKDGDSLSLYMGRFRVLGVNKKTGMVWVKGRGFQTRLVDAAEVQA